MSCGVGHRHGSSLALLWLWGRLVATALIQPQAWEFPYAKGVALKRQKIRIKNKNQIIYSMLSFMSSLYILVI